MSNFRIDRDYANVQFDEGYLTIADYEVAVVEVRLTPNEALNLASVLLQYATQNGASDG